MHQELANVVFGAQGGGLRPCVAQAEGCACQHNCARLAQGIQHLSTYIWDVSIQKKFVEVEKFSFIQKQQSYSLGVISSELTCTLLGDEVQVDGRYDEQQSKKNRKSIDLFLLFSTFKMGSSVYFVDS